MQTENMAEYKILRTEMDSIKNCMTHYIGFLFLGIGAVLSVWAAILPKDPSKWQYASVGYSALAISLVATFMLFVLVYKFVSHNRYAGYCLLLNQEKWLTTRHHVHEMVVWELCIDMLRALQSRVGNQLPWPYDRFGSYLEPDGPGLSRVGAWRSMWFLMERLATTESTASWGFPVIIVRIFFVVIWSCFGFGTFILCSGAAENGLLDLAQLLTSLHSMGTYLGAILQQGITTVALLCAILVPLLVLWFRVASNFHAIMDGESTVLSFFRRFRPIREAVLKDFAIAATWTLHP